MFIAATNETRHEKCTPVCMHLQLIRFGFSKATTGVPGAETLCSTGLQPGTIQRRSCDSGVGRPFQACQAVVAA